MISRKQKTYIKTLVVLQLFVSSFMFSQPDCELTYDFINESWNSCGTPGLPGTVDFGKTYQVKIVNFNTLLYKVKDESSQRSLYIDPPSSFSSISLSGFVNTTVQQTPRVSLPVVTGTGEKMLWAPGDEMSGGFMEFEGGLGYPAISSKEIREQLGEDVEFKFIPGLTFFNETQIGLGDFDSLSDEKNEDLKVLTLADVNQFEAYVRALAVDQRSPEFIAAKAYFEKVKRADFEVISLLSNCGEEYKEIRRRAIETFIGLQNASFYTANLNDFEKDLIGENEVDYSRLIGNIKNEIEREFSLLASHDDQAMKDPLDKEAIVGARKYLSENKFSVLENNFRTINRENFTYFLSPQKVKADDLTIKFEVSRSKPLPCPVRSPIVVSESLKSKGEWPKVSFSTGLFGLFGDDDFMSRQLSFIPVAGQPDMVEVSDANEGSNVIPSIGALLHLSLRNERSWSPAISLGVSTTSGFDNVNILIGPSLILGRKSRIIISGGLVARESVVADGNYPVGSMHLRDLAPEAVPSSKVFPKWGYFLGISINWTDPSKL